MTLYFENITAIITKVDDPYSHYTLVSSDLLHGGVLAETSCELLDVVFSQMFVERLFISPPRNNHEPEILSCH